MEEIKLAQIPVYEWEWYVFGDDPGLVVQLVKSSLWHRILTRILFRSKWKKLNTAGKPKGCK